MHKKETNWRVVVVLVVCALLGIASLGIIGLVLSTIPSDKSYSAIVLSLMLLSGIVALIAILAVIVALFSALGLSDASQPFGMPEGTVQAVIALGLILIFAITAVFLYGQLLNYKSDPALLTQEQLNALPANQIISSQPSTKEGYEGYFEVVHLFDYNTSSSADFAKQILTTVSTLVVAVAAFYFGTRVAARKADFQPTLRLLSPASSAKLGKNMTKLVIRLETKPAGLAIEGWVNGYVDDALKQVKYDEFEYQPATPPSEPVILTFSLVNNPEVTQTVRIEAEPPASGTTP